MGQVRRLTSVQILVDAIQQVGDELLGVLLVEAQELLGMPAQGGLELARDVRLALPAPHPLDQGPEGPSQLPTRAQGVLLVDVGLELQERGGEGGQIVVGERVGGDGGQEKGGRQSGGRGQGKDEPRGRSRDAVSQVKGLASFRSGYLLNPCTLSYLSAPEVLAQGCRVGEALERRVHEAGVAEVREAREAHGMGAGVA